MDSVQNMASSSSSSEPSSRPSSHYISQTKTEMESAKARHWSQLAYPTTDSELSAESNLKYFASLKEDPQWCRFFTDFERLEVGEKISEGAQADIYEARNTRDGPFDFVVKVMKGDAPLKTFQAQWPIGMLSARSKYKHLFDLPLITILGGTVLRDERLRGRFAFVMYRRWGDLRLLIDRRMKQERNTRGPFSMDQAIHLMLTIAGDMDVLYNKHDIIHRDLKASNMLVWGELGGDMSLITTLDRAERIGSIVADFECSVGVMGTWFWMAPEILEQLEAGVPSSEVRFTLWSDVYSYGMTCYEIVTGCLPYDGLQVMDMISQVLQGRRPKLPHDLPEFVRNIIVSCWHSNPSERSNFSAICMALQERRGFHISVVVDNKSNNDASIVKVENWKHREALTLLEVMQILMDMDLLILRAFGWSSTTTITHSFEVVDCKGRKVVKDKSIANLRKALSFPVMHDREWISSSMGMSSDENTLPQMHVIYVVAEWSVGFLAVLSRLLVTTNWSKGFLGVLSRLLVATNFRVLSAECWTRKGRLECVINVKGARVSALLWELRHDMKYFQIPTGRFKVVVNNVATKKFSYLNSRLQNLKSLDLTRPCNPSNIRVHLRKGSGESVRSTEVVVCLENRGLLVDVLKQMDLRGYLIVRASIEYQVPYDFQHDSGKKSEDIDVGTLAEGEREKIYGILRVADERGCSGGNAQLIVSGPSGVVHEDLMRSLHESGLVVTGGEVYREFGTGLSDPSGDLVCFVSKQPTAGSR